MRPASSFALREAFRFVFQARHERDGGLHGLIQREAFNRNNRFPVGFCRIVQAFDAFGFSQMAAA